MKKALKKIYAILPFKKQLFSLIKIFSPSQNIYKHLSFIGAFEVEVAGKKFKTMHYGYELENEIFWKGLAGGWESECIIWWVKLCANADVILDIGASTGIYALIAKTTKPMAKVFAFEPLPKVFEKLQQNIALNNFEIKSYSAALSDYDGTGTIAMPDVEMLYSVTINQPLDIDNKNYKAIDVETIRLATFIEQQKLPKVDLMKIDVETHEGEVLLGMGDYLAKYKPIMLIEILNEEVGAKVEKLTLPIGYRFYHIAADSSLVEVTKLIGHSRYYNYLLVAGEMAV